MAAAIPEYLVLGHCTRDLLLDGRSTDGGTALYSAVAADRLGQHTAVFTAAPARPHALPNTISFALTPSETISTFENIYSTDGRIQWLHAVAAPLQLDLLPLAWRQTPLVQLGPVLHELELAAALDFFPMAQVAVTPQGWMRRWDTVLPAHIERAVWMPDPSLLARIDLLVISIEDLGGDEQLARTYSRFCRCVALTRSVHGSTIYLDGQPHYVPTTPVRSQNPTGLGDVYAAALLIRIHETGDALRAARFATAVAAATAAGSGFDAIPTRTSLRANASLIDL